MTMMNQRQYKESEDRIYFSMKVIGSEMKVTEFVFKFNLIFMAIIFALLTMNGNREYISSDFYYILIALLKWVFILFGTSLLTSSVSFFIWNKILQNAFIILAGTTVEVKNNDHVEPNHIVHIADSQKLLDKNVGAAQLISNITLSLFCAALLLFVLSAFVTLFRM